jgi:hypothetical protein
MRVKEHLRTVVVTSLLAGFPAFAQTETPPTDQRAPTAMTTEQQAAKNLEVWRAARRGLLPTKEGCYTSSYPSDEWQSATCVTAPQRPYPAARGRRPDFVGNGTDASVTPAGLIYSAVGSFDLVTGVTSESGQVDNTGPSVANAFSLQLNTQTFQTPLCNSSGCVGWQQFVYSNACGDDACVFMQYWLIDYVQPCPRNWTPFSGDGAPGCYINSNAVLVSRQPIQNLREMTLNGNAAPGSIDTVIFHVGNTLYLASGADGVLQLSQHWQSAEFNVVGDGGGGQANFNSGSSIVVRTAVDSGSALPPACSPNGFTAETNNLYLAPASAIPPVSRGTLPAIVFMENSIASATPPCDAAFPLGTRFGSRPHVVYTYCIGQYTVGGGCNGNQQKYWDCGHNGQEFPLGEGVCYSGGYTFFKTMRTQPAVGGNLCGYSNGLMFCTDADTPDRLCDASDSRYGCAAGPVSYR